MDIDTLIAVISQLRVAQALTDPYEAELPLGSSRASRTWRNQKEHLLGWFGDYGGPGAYCRQQGSADPRIAYNRFQCAPGLIWLAEALGEDTTAVESAIAAARAAEPRAASQCGAVRRVIPWSRIEELAAARLSDRHTARALDRLQQSPTERPANNRRGRVAGRPKY